VAPLASRPLLLGAGIVVVGVLIAGALTGCETTQKAAARVQLRNERDLAAREPIKVDQQSPDVDVVNASVVHGSDGSDDAAIAVTLENTTDHPVNDLPIEVGVKTADGKDQVLNDGRELPYFQAHTPAIAAGARTTWVYVSKDDLAGTDEAFAKVGATPSDPALAQAATLPDVTAAADPAADGDKTTVEVTNSSDFNQYALVVFAWAVDGDKIVAAGQADGGDLEPGMSKSVAVKLIGSPKGARVEVAAPPTIFK
jgi:hypothetical protein